MKYFMKNSIKIGVCAGLIFLAFIATGCDGKSKGSAGFQRAAGIKDSKLSMNSYASSYMPEAAYFDSAEFVMEEEAAVPTSVAVPELVEGAAEFEYERKLIRTGNVSLEVKTVSDAEEKIASWAKGLGGYVTNANIWENGANFTVRIPSTRFDDAMAQAGDFGRVTEHSVNSQDVSDNYYDLESRLKTKYILRDKLSGYLSQAKDIKDLLEIERQLNQVLEEIVAVKAFFVRLHKCLKL